MMAHSKYVKWLLFIAAVALVVGAVFLFVNRAHAPTEEELQGSISEQAILEFSETLQAKVIAQIGQPIEGFVPFMFLEVYPGLEEADFDGVQASIGKYVQKDFGLVHEFGENNQLVHSAAGAITEEGMHTLLFNVVRRLGFNLEGEDTIADVITALESDAVSPTAVQPTAEEVTVTGTIGCLPSKATDGPVTLECAIGLKGDDGHYYSLDTREVESPELFQQPSGTKIQVTGRFAPMEALSSDHWQKYDFRGILWLTSAKKI